MPGLVGGLARRQLSATGRLGRCVTFGRSDPLLLEMQLLEDCCETALGEELFADNLTAFAVLEVRGGGGRTTRGQAQDGLSGAVAAVREH
jgi:hypothetical protein